MNGTKLRATLIVFLVGFALGLSVFAASRLFVRSVVSAEAKAVAEELSRRIAAGDAIEPSGSLASLMRYTRFDENGAPTEARNLPAAGPEPGSSGLPRPEAVAAVAARGKSAVVSAPLLPSLLGLSDSAVSGVLAPIVKDGRSIGAVYAQFRPTSASGALFRGSTTVAVTTLGLAVLAVMLIAFAVNRGGGLGGRSSIGAGKGLAPDPLTGLRNREGFEAALADSVKRAAKADQQVGLMIVDLDGFRTLNEVWGQAAGDEVLRIATARLQGFAKGPSALSRISGNAFALVVEHNTSSHALRQLADSVRESFKAPFLVGDSSIELTAGIGAAVFPVNAQDAKALFAAAEMALAKAKSDGRSALAFFDTEMDERIRQRSHLERDLRQALDRDEFVIFYQPQLELATGKVRGYEALVRWERPGQGILAPREFLAVAEQTGLIRPIGEWVLRKACQDAQAWLDAGIVSVNFSAAQFQFRDVEATVAKILQDTGLRPDRLEIEVPERLFLSDPKELLETLRRIKALGVRVAMDDFGSTYSGLASLARFPFDKIKIDRSFVGQVTEDPDVAAIVASIVALGRSLSVDITAEGVETADQLTLLKASGCNIVQGYLFGAPNRDAGSAPAEDGAAAAQSA
jgi:diguanylate cyclase (GGDEF)-like protein